MASKNLFGKAIVIGEMAMEAAKKKMSETGVFFDLQLEKAEKFFNEKKEVIEIKVKIADKKEELEQMFAEYGKLCYYAAEEDKVAVDDAKAAIEGVEMEISTLSKQLVEMLAETAEGSIFCTKCGTEHTTNDGFCCKCGVELKK